MRPGSEERIALYCRRAEAGEPLFDDIPKSCFESIPLLPQLKKRATMQKLTITEAIEVLTDDTAIEELSASIRTKEEELNKLKKVFRMLTGKPTSSGRKLPSTMTEDRKQLERRIMELLESTVEPLTPKQIGDRLGVGFMNVGKCVSASDQLEKDGTYVVLAN